MPKGVREYVDRGSFVRGFWFLCVCATFMHLHASSCLFSVLLALRDYVLASYFSDMLVIMSLLYRVTWLFLAHIVLLPRCYSDLLWAISLYSNISCLILWVCHVGLEHISNHNLLLSLKVAYVKQAYLKTSNLIFILRGCHQSLKRERLKASRPLEWVSMINDNG
jgi:hypothetical protein